MPKNTVFCADGTLDDSHDNSNAMGISNALADTFTTSSPFRIRLR
jgi:hypothetical protein